MSGFEQVTAVGDDGGVLLVGTPNGLFLVHPERHSRSAVLPRPEDPSSISHAYIRRIYRDRGGLLWIGTDGGGLNKMMFDRERARYVFTRYQQDPSNPYGLRSNAIESLYEDRSGVLWIGTIDGGLCRFDPSVRQFISYRTDAADPGTISNDNVNVILDDGPETLWVGTISGLNLMNVSTGRRSGRPAGSSPSCSYRH